MNDLAKLPANSAGSITAQSPAAVVPLLVAVSGDAASWRYVEF